MSYGDRRRQQTALHTVATPPAPLLLIPASQGLTLNTDDVQLSSVLMPMPQAADADADAQLGVGNTCSDVFVTSITWAVRFSWRENAYSRPLFSARYFDV